MNQPRALFVVLLLLISSGVASAAMVDPPMRVRGGVRLGLSAASESTSRYNYSESAVAGVVGGGFAEFPLSTRLSLIAEGDFIMKGSQLNQITGTTSVTDHLYYIEVPLLVKVHWDWTKVRVFALGGPQVGFLLAANRSDNVAGTSSSVKSSYNTIDAGMALGGGVALPVSENLDVFFEGRLGIGIADVDSTGYSARNDTVQLSAGLEF